MSLLRFWTRKQLKSENGSALLMALSVIMVLAAFGTASLMTSVANIHMSTKYRDWSKDYYALDMNAENKLNQLNGLLQNAESNAQAYMSGQYYRYSDPASVSPSDLQVPLFAQNFINDRWLIDVAPYMEDMNNPSNKMNLENFLSDTVQRLYYYYASEKLSSGGYTSVKYLDNITASLGNYQAALFSSELSGTQVLLEGNLVVDINSADAINAITAIDPISVKGKSVAVKVDVRFPTYEVQTQTKHIPIQGNPVWANAITSAGNIGFVGAGTSTINGDIFSAASSETLPINDYVVTDSGIYSQGANVQINGNVYSKGNLHIIGNNSTINVQNYPTGFVVDLKNNIFATNNLYFDLLSIEKKHTEITVINYIQGSSSGDIPMVYLDNDGGNVYCNSLAVQGHYVNNPTLTVSDGKINVAGNVTTYNDIRMDGLNSEITVEKNYIGINSAASGGDPNASSSVINNTPLTAMGGTESKITLNGDFIVPGTAFAKYTGVKKAGDPFYTWADSYYQTGESVSARNPDIYGAYLATVSDPLTGYNYYYDQFTSDPEPADSDESGISSYSFIRADAEGTPPIIDALKPKIMHLIDFLNDKFAAEVIVRSNVFSSPLFNGYSQGVALLQKPGDSSVTVYSYELSDDNYVNYHNFKLCLADIFKAKTQQLGTAIPLGIGGGFDGAFVKKDAIIKDDNLITVSGINSIPTTTPDSFVYIKQEAASTSTLNLNLGNYSGIIYCEGNLEIIGNGSFDGTIICQGNVTVSGSPTITYNEGVILSTLMANSNIRKFFAMADMPVVTYKDYESYNGAVRTDVVRYKILEWKEKQQ